MLFDRSFATLVAVGDIVSFKLINGDELTGKLVGMGDDHSISILRPVGVSLQMISPQQAGIGFVPFMASIPDDQTVQFEAKALLIKPMKTRADVAAQYIRATTGIEVPSAATKGLIGL